MNNLSKISNLSDIIIAVNTGVHRDFTFFHKVGQIPQLEELCFMAH